jgi:hypothetical protein
MVPGHVTRRGRYPRGVAPAHLAASLMPNVVLLLVVLALASRLASRTRGSPTFASHHPLLRATPRMLYPTST